MSARILVVDDDPWILRMVTASLRKRQFTVDTARDGRQALDRVRAHVPAVIITDVMMPGMDGWTLVKQLRQDPRLATIPVIFLTALAKDEARLRALGLTDDDYLSKPFRFEDLEKRVDAALQPHAGASGPHPAGRPPSGPMPAATAPGPPVGYPPPPGTTPNSGLHPLYPPGPTHNSGVHPLPGPYGYPPQQGQYPGQYPPQPPGQYPGQYPPPPPGQYPGQYPPQQGQYPPQQGQYPPQGQYPGQYPPQPPGQYPPPPPGQYPTGPAPVANPPAAGGSPPPPPPPATAESGASRSRKGTALNGKLEQLGLSSLLVMMEMERKQGVLSLMGPDSDATGRIYLRGGQVVRATIDDQPTLEGKECVYRMLAWQTGTFSFTATTVDAEDSVQSSTTHLLMEGARLIDEAGRNEGL